MFQSVNSEKKPATGLRRNNNTDEVVPSKQVHIRPPFLNPPMQKAAEEEDNVQAKTDTAPSNVLQCALDADTLVVRGGLSSADTLKTNQERDSRGHISANAANGETLETLATTPQAFPNGKLTKTTVGTIKNLKNTEGENMDVIEDSTKSNPYHASIDPKHKPMDDNEANNLSNSFAQIANEWK